MIEFLNEVHKAQLTANNQHCAGKLVARILVLEGTPTLTQIGPMKAGADVKTQLESELALKLDGIPRLTAAIKYASEVGDNASRGLFQEILANDEEHVDHLEGQLHTILEIGIENYLVRPPHRG